MNSPVDQIKSRLDILSVVQSYVKLQRAGSNFKAACPFHSEKNPSFFVSPAREIWHCFSCNRGGDIFSFVMEIEGMEFPEALKLLAQRAGVELKREDPRLRSEKAKLLDILKEAVDFYEKELLKNKAVLDYLKDRGLKSETIKNFKIGFAPGPFSAQSAGGWRNIYSFLRRRGYFDAEIEKAGLIVMSGKQHGNYYDRFRNRIMFPITDLSGRVVGFSGRIFGPEKEGVGKYINSPQTVLYDKSRILYGFDKAKFDIRKKDYCILVEGQMDVLMSHQAGVENIVAVSGTALTLDHIKIISRLTSNISIAFDRDEAGFAAAKRSVELLLNNGFEVKAIPISFGNDPADIIKKNPALWIDCLKNSEHIIDFYLNFLKEKFSDEKVFRKEIEKNILPYLVSFQSEIERSYWVGKIAKALNVQEEPVWLELKKLPQSSAKKSVILTNSQSNIELKTKAKESRAQILESRIIGLTFLFFNTLGKDKDRDKDKDRENRDLCKKFLKTIKSNIRFISEQNRDILNKFLKKNSEGALNENLKKCHYKCAVLPSSAAETAPNALPRSLIPFILEAEMIYNKDDPEDFLREAEVLTANLKKEVIRSKLKTLAGEIHRLENEGNQKKLFATIKKFNDLSKQL
jgi:DNA primase